MKVIDLTERRSRALTKTAVALGLCTLTLYTSACSTSAWYEGFRNGQRQQCEQLGGSARDECLERVNNLSYEEYQQQKDSLQRR